MKKKLLLVLVIGLLAVSLLTACNFDDTSGTNNGGGSNTSVNEVKTACATLNNLLDAKCDNMSITIQTKTDGFELESVFTVATSGTKTEVEYSIERLNTIAKQDGKLVMPDSYKSTDVGSVEIENGKITKQNGVPTSIALESVTAKEFSFNESYFSSATAKDGTFTATVEKPKEFTGGNYATATDMKVTATYSARLISIVLTYTDSTSDVTVTYEFND